MLTPDEVMVSWLPLYHDMGLVGFLAIPMTKGVELVQAAPQDFMAHPGTGCSGSPTGAARRPRARTCVGARHAALRRATDLDLSSLTLALSGAEPVDPSAVEAFVAAAEPFGFKSGSVFPAFGMAEVAIAGRSCAAWRPRVRHGRPRGARAHRAAKPIELVDADDEALAARRLPLLGTRGPGLEMMVVHPRHVRGAARASRR